jgi:hypothetical protein
VEDLKNKITTLLDDDTLYDKIRVNAEERSAGFIDPPVNFAKAIEGAFSSPVD